MQGCCLECVVFLVMQIVMELVELKEGDTARALLRQTAVFQRMKREQPDRLLQLERFCSMTYFDVRYAVFSPVLPRSFAAVCIL